MGTATSRAARPPRLSRRAFLPLLVALALSSVPLTARGASDVRILVDGRTITLPGTYDTVREALVQARVTLDDDDEVQPDPHAPLPAGGVIRVSRVEYREGTSEVKVPYRTIVRQATGKKRPYHPTVIRHGRSGLKRFTYRARLVDGREVERTVLSEELVREPEPQFVVARYPHQLASRGAYAGKRTFRMLATAYDPGAGSCGRYADGRTCNGKRAGYGIIAVDPRMIPLGTKLFVPGYGFGIAADVGGAIKGYRVDLGFNSRSGSMKWGKKWVTVSVVE